MEKITPVLAKDTDLDDVVKIVRDLSRWLKSKGVSQWSDAFPRKILEEEMTRDELYVLREDGTIIGTVALGSEPGELWNDFTNSSIYLHRLAILRSRAGRRLGEAIMKWAEAETKRKGFNSLRLVCDASNPFLPTYYKGLGYMPCGVKLYEPWNMTFARFEKAIH